MTDTTPKIDFTKIDFPSDRITVKILRQVHPTATDVDVPIDSIAPLGDPRSYRRHTLDDPLGCGIIDLERQIAERAFKIALGQSVKGSNLSNIDEMVDNISDEYKKYGLARGEHEISAMIRRIETQAEAQARQHGMTGRG